ncbi:hypothetical protein ACH5RR_030857 [Cinchona calisaya]|uniref:Uncharacterized protein n=1 Tax=Cinchona calisaya TaxID=153742 RepID=A0ABD2YWZ9_9GENT
MGRRKVEIKKIEDKSSRQVTFSKRRKGMMKKAQELSVLCDVDVAVLVFSTRGKLYDFCSTNSLAKILERYHSYTGAAEQAYTGTGTAGQCSFRCGNFLTIQKLLEKVGRDLDEPDVNNLNLRDILHLEEQLEDALILTRSRKTHLLMESITGLSEMEKMLRQENKLLQDKIAGSKQKRNDMILEFGDLIHVRRISACQQTILKLL